jgi:membrane protein
MVLLAASIAGLVLAGNRPLQEQIDEAILEAVPGDTGEFLVRQIDAAISTAGVTGLIGALFLFYAGLRLMDKLRIGVRRVWTGRPVEGDFLKDNLRDAVSFVALAAVLLLIGRLGLSDVPGIFLLTTVVGITLALLADTVVFLWLLKVVAHTRVGVRAILPGAMFGAVGFEILKVLGSLYLSLSSGSITATTLGGAVGILVWINLVSRYALFTTAWTAFLPAVRRQRPPVEESAAAVA